jgi:hypothetical protein
MRSTDMVSLISISFVFFVICGCETDSDITVPPGSLPSWGSH